MRHVAIFLWAALLVFSTNASYPTNDCHCLPVDECWPGREEWDRFNSTVGGRLVATVPIASVCHDPNYDEAACAALRANWTLGPTHYDSSSSIMEIYWANRSCDPFTAQTEPCVIGNYVSYAVNVSGTQDVAATVSFAKTHNIRFIVRNTAHDFFGRSTGAGGLAVWTHYLKDTASVDWSDDFYRGPAFRMGAGVQGFEAVDAAAKDGRVVVGGLCPTVGIAEGYLQGGGHSPLSTAFGLAADQTLSFEVVTAAGEVVTASRSLNPDLFWALSGGGAGNYGVVTSVTVRSYADLPVGGASFFIDPSQTTEEKYWKALTFWYALVPKLTDAGLTITFVHNASFFTFSQLTAYNQTSAAVESHLSPFTNYLTNLSIPYFANYTSSPTYASHWSGLYPADGPVGNFWQLSGRIVPRDTNATALTSAIRTMSSATNGSLLFGVTALDGRSRTGSPSAANPAWRSASMLISSLVKWDFAPGAWETNLAKQRQGTEELDPVLDAATPGGGNYGNEADAFRADWKEAFYGENYGELEGVKSSWDPDGVFYGRTAVGSDAWQVGQDGRMCRVGSK